MMYVLRVRHMHRKNMKDLVSITGNILHVRHVLCTKREAFSQYHWLNAALARRICETMRLNDYI